MFQQGRVYFPSTGILYTDHTGKQENLIDVLINKEMLTFPYGIHPDMVDALAQVLDEEVAVYYPASPQPAGQILPYNMERDIMQENNNRNSWLDL